MRKCALLEAVIGVKCPLSPAGGGLGIQPVGREHHQDEVGVQLLLLFFRPAQIFKISLHTCRHKSVGKQETKKEDRRRSPGRLSHPPSTLVPDFLLSSRLHTGPASAHPLSP